MFRVPFFCALRGLLLAVAFLLSGPAAPAWSQGDSTPVNDGRFAAVTQPQFRLMERISFPGELIRNAVWLDDGHYLCLTVSPDGARVWMVDYETGERSLFISASFFGEHIAAFPECLNLAWSLSRSRQYMFLHWPDSAGQNQWRLLDISDPPFFVSKTFDPPGGMNIHDILFSHDDRYAVFSNDSYAQGSAVSMLVLDLENGSETWRISTHDLSFVRRIWWDDFAPEARCYAAVELQQGEFQDLPGLAVLDIGKQTLSFDSARVGMLMGDSAEWGMVSCFMSADQPDVPYFIRADIPGHGDNMQVPLSDAPLDLVCLDEPGLILLRNTLNYSISQLWLIDMLQGDKLLVSGDSEHFETGPAGRLLIVPRGSNELHVMQLFLPEEGRTVQ